MAHKGKPWPVLFRRDWNLNVANNNVGWPNRYLCKLVIKPLPPPDPLEAIIWDCGPATFNPPDQMFWFSQLVVVGGTQYAVLLQSFIRPDGSSYALRGNLLAQAGVTAAIWRPISDGWQHANWPKSLDRAVLYWNPAFFTTQPLIQLSTVDPKLWSDGPPH